MGDVLEGASELITCEGIRPIPLFHFKSQGTKRAKSSTGARRKMTNGCYSRTKIIGLV